MKRELIISKILVYYDLPELFIAKDKVGGKYMSLLVEELDNKPHYILTPISDYRFTNFLKGHVDLREIFETPEIIEFYSILNITSEIFQAILLDDKKLPEKFLPEAGYFYQLEKSLNEDLIIEEATKMDRTIIHFILADSFNRNTIQIEALGDFLKIFQNFVKNAYKKFMLKQKNKKDFDYEKDTLLRAFASSEGSFNIHLLSDSDSRDLWLKNNMDKTLDIIDVITQDFTSEEDFIKTLQSVKGHTISSYKKLVDKIVRDNIEIKYKWFSIGSEKVHTRELDRDFAKKVLKILNSKQELGIELKFFEGIVQQIDVKKRTWRILNTEDNKEYNGETNNKALLKNIIVDSVRYKFMCEEILEEEVVSEKEKIKYMLIEIEKID